MFTAVKLMAVQLSILLLTNGHTELSVLHFESEGLKLIAIVP